MQTENLEYLLQQKDEEIAKLEEIVTSYQIAMEDYQMEIEKLVEENKSLRKLLPDVFYRQ